MKFMNNPSYSFFLLIILLNISNAYFVIDPPIINALFAKNKAFDKEVKILKPKEFTKMVANDFNKFKIKRKKSNSKNFRNHYIDKSNAKDINTEIINDSKPPDIFDENFSLFISIGAFCLGFIFSGIFVILAYFIT